MDHHPIKCTLMPIQRTLLLTLAFLASFVALSAQSPEAIVEYNKASKLFKAKQYAGAVKFYEKAIQLDSTFNDARRGLAESYDAQGNVGSAIVHYDKLTKFKPLDPTIWYSLGTLHYKSQDYVKARRAVKEALRLRPEYPTAKAAMKKIEEKLKNTPADVVNAEEVDKLAAKVNELGNENKNLAAQGEEAKRREEEMRMKVEASQNEIAKMTITQAKSRLALERQKHFLDSFAYVRTMDSIKLRQSEQEVQQAKDKDALQQSQRNFLLALAAIGILAALALLGRYLSSKKLNTTLAEKNKIIEAEKLRSDELLLNILPTTVAEELKTHQKAEARYYGNVTVMFTDFQGFSQKAGKMSPSMLVEYLDHCFRAFDEIIARHGLEKIKTIGDAYMCAGGLPVPDDTHAIRVTQAALEIQKFLATWKEERRRSGEVYFEARIGINSGPVVAGVVGAKKFAYDIWGDTVNIAARMESSGETGKVNISQSTYQLVKDQYKCTYRGKFPIKNIGEVDMYFID